jgi:hypothetical protein
MHRKVGGTVLLTNDEMGALDGISSGVKLALPSEARR